MTSYKELFDSLNLEVIELSKNLQQLEHIQELKKDKDLKLDNPDINLRNWIKENCINIRLKTREIEGSL